MDDDDEGLDEGKPPTVSDEVLEKLDIEAGFTEIQRLLQMGALRNLNNAELEQGNVLTTKMVYDWRMRENRSTAHGVVISPHEKYISELVKLHGMEHRKPEQTPDIGYDSLDGPGLFDMDKHLFRSSMGTLLYLSQDRVDTQHAARNLSQWMLRPTKLALDGVKHVFLYLS